MSVTSNEEFLEKVRWRVSETAVGASTLRNQGAPGVVAAAREFFREMNLEEFSSEDREEYLAALDQATITLKRKFPGGANGNWGAARKAINLFLRDALYNHLLRERFKLEKSEKFMEVPLDRDVTTWLRDKANGTGGVELPKWNGIKNLKEDVSQKYQDFADTAAHDLNIARVHLDLWCWRAKGSQET